MKLYRCFAWNERAKAADPDGPLWFPTTLQGEGRHDNPDLFGCLYVSERHVSAVVEQLARFRGGRLIPSLLRRGGLPLALATIDLADPGRLVDLAAPPGTNRMAQRIMLRNRFRCARIAPCLLP